VTGKVTMLRTSEFSTRDFARCNAFRGRPPQHEVIRLSADVFAIGYDYRQRFCE